MTLKTRQLKQLKIDYSQLVWGIILILLFYASPLIASEYHSHEQIRNTAILSQGKLIPGLDSNNVHKRLRPAQV